MKEYRVVEEFPLERTINKAAREGFRAVLMACDDQGLLTVLMEKDVEEPGRQQECIDN